MNTPLISIIIPVYNVEPYLRECVDSVLRQTYSNLEIILVDDGSTDGSSAICDEYAQKDKRVKVIHKPNSGPSDARNKGIDAATGEYIYFMDSDDYIADTAMEDCLSVIEREQADFVFFDALQFHEKADGSIRFRPWYMRRNIYMTEKGYNVLSQLIDNCEYTPSAPFVFFRMKFIHKYNFQFHADIMSGEDLLYISLMFLCAERVAHLNKPLYFYRRRITADSITTSPISGNIFIGYAAVFCEVLRIYSSDKLISEARIVVRKLALDIFKTSMRIFYRLNPSDRKKVIENKQELCQAIGSAWYLKSPVVLLYINSIIYRLPKHIDIMKMLISRRFHK